MSVVGSKDPAENNPLWHYCVTLYAAPGLKEWVLGLQDRLAIDVNFVLLAGWCGRHGVELSTDDWGHLNRITAPLRCGLVAPLRRQRRRLESRAPATVRHHLLQAELAAERALYEQLWQWWCAAWPAPPVAASTRVGALAAANLSTLADFYGVPRFLGDERLTEAVDQRVRRQSARDSEGSDGLPF